MGVEGNFLKRFPRGGNRLEEFTPPRLPEGTDQVDLQASHDEPPRPSDAEENLPPATQMDRNDLPLGGEQREDGYFLQRENAGRLSFSTCPPGRTMIASPVFRVLRSEASNTRRRNPRESREGVQELRSAN